MYPVSFIKDLTEALAKTTTASTSKPLSFFKLIFISVRSTTNPKKVLISAFCNSLKVDMNEFAGCLYESPVKATEARDWRVDPDSGARYPFDLTTSEIQTMNISGVPMKIEHTEDGFEEGDEVGRVTDVTVDPETGYSACKFRLHDTVAGRTVQRLIENGTLDSLSLGHLYDHRDGSVEAKEVSICFNGAREGTRLYKELSEYEQFKTRIDKMEAVEQEKKTSGASVMETDIAPSPAAVESAPVELDITELLAKCTENVPERIANELYTQVANLASQLKTGTEEHKRQLAMIDDLKSNNEKYEDQIAKNAKKTQEESKKIVSVMNALLAEYCGSDADQISAALDDQTAQSEVFRAVPVLASALKGRKQENSSRDKDEAIKQIKAALFPPAWEEKEKPVAVNASARGRGEASDPSEGPNKRFAALTHGQRSALAGLNSFTNGGSMSVTADMLPQNFKGMPAGPQ